MATLIRKKVQKMKHPKIYAQRSNILKNTCSCLYDSDCICKMVQSEGISALFKSANFTQFATGVGQAVKYTPCSSISPPPPRLPYIIEYNVKEGEQGLIELQGGQGVYYTSRPTPVYMNFKPL